MSRITAILLGLIGLLAVVFGVLLIIFLVTAREEETTSGPAKTASRPSQGLAKVGAEFRRLGSDPPTLDPHLSGDVASSQYIVEIFSGLVTLSRDLEIIPDIAERWERSSDGTLYTFYLRRNVEFHDGKKFTAQDVKYSFERAGDPRTQSTRADTYLGDIVGMRDKLNRKATTVRGVQVLDDYTLTIQIDAPKAYFLALLTYPTAFVVDKDNVEPGGTVDRRWTDRPNGTGPFKLAEWKKGERIVLDANKNFYRGAPTLERAVFELAGGSSMTMYENNEVDYTFVSALDLERVLDPTNPLHSELVIAPELSVFFIGFNVERPPFDDVKVRQALNHAVDKEAIVQGLFQGMVATSYGILPPGMEGHNPNLEGLRYDPERAKRLITESKYGSAAKMPPIVITTVGGLGSASPVVEAVIEMWKDNLGLKVEIQQVEFATYLDDLEKRRFQIFEAGGQAEQVDAWDFLDTQFHSESQDNDMGYSNPTVDRLLEQARVEQDRGKRIELYRQVEQTIVKDAPWIPLFFGKQYVLVKPWVKNYLVPPITVEFLKDVSIVGKP